MKRVLSVLTFGLMLLSLAVLSGCSGSNAEAFLGQWKLNVDKTVEANKKAFEGDEQVGKMAISLFSGLSLEVTADDATFSMGKESKTSKYTVEGHSLVLKTGSQKAVFKLLEDGKAIAMLNEKAGKGEIGSFILTKE